MLRSTRSWMCGVGVAVLAATAAAGEEQKLVAADAAPTDEFGTALAISGDTAVVGAPSAGPPGDAGVAYVFDKGPGGWAQVARLQHSGAVDDDAFGMAVAIDGDVIVVGAPGVETGALLNTGAAFVFVRPAGGWTDMTETARLSTDQIDRNDRLGDSVAISGDTIVVGSSYDQHGSHPTFGKGSAYVYVRPGGGWTGMTQTAWLTASNGRGSDAFGSAVAIDDDTVVVGATWGDHQPFSESGTAYVFDRPSGGWQDMQESFLLAAGDANQADRYGRTVSISGDTILVGAPWNDDACVDYDLCQSGSAYVYVRQGSGWVEQAKLLASNAARNDWFGWSVDVDGDVAVIGSVLSDDGVTTSGTAYLFERDGTTWTERTRMFPGDAGSYDRFGSAVAVDGVRALVGAHHQHSQGIQRSGSAYLFRVGADWTDLGHALDGARGEPVLRGSGSLWGGSSFSLSLDNGLANSTAVLIVGGAEVLAPFRGGTLVPQPAQLFVFGTGATGEVQLDAAWPEGIAGKTQAIFQYWIVDPAGPFGMSASNGLSALTP